ncbi:hypothetical protein BDN70DRAFT_936265 [Pholiota conissans]|uniref:Uncharacterized protein n=1 Tax=Pholiota conissans TaxID=109636 RepID=A0A9P5YUR1_9AGAR|nr:hypothetical protein BDN70DRAFT_936265 [Pholiota conissans]
MFHICNWLIQVSTQHVPEGPPPAPFASLEHDAFASTGGGDEEGIEIVEGSVNGEDDGYSTDDVFIAGSKTQLQPRTPTRNRSFFDVDVLSRSQMSARRKNFLACYNIPQTPPSQLPSHSRHSHLGAVSPAPRRVNLRPYWKGEFERMGALLKDTQAKLHETEYQLRQAKEEIARLMEFGGDVHLGLEEIARQRAFMARVGEILSQGRFEGASGEDIAQE